MSNNFAEREKNALLQQTVQECTERAHSPISTNPRKAVPTKIISSHGKNRGNVSEKGSPFCVKMGNRFHCDRLLRSRSMSEFLDWLNTYML